MRAIDEARARQSEAAGLKSRWLIVAALVTLGLCGTAGARTWQVPGDVGTIKTALEDSSSYGDTVLVAPATYDTTSGESFPIVMASGVVLLSEIGPAATIIDANATNRVFDCTGLDSSTVIAGFTITGGLHTQGAGLCCTDSYLEIRDNIITGNIATDIGAQGGGLYLTGGAPRIVANDILANKARKNMGAGLFCGGETAAIIEANNICENVARYGGGIFMQYCGPLFRGNTVSRNKSLATGAGVDCSFSSYAIVTGNVISHNSASSDGPGIACCYNASPVITYNTIAGNSGTFGGGVRSLGGSSPSVWANVILDNVDGIYLMEDSDSIYAHANNIYHNSFQSGDHEAINHTSFNMDLSGNWWGYADSMLVAGLISGPAYFMPFRDGPIDTVPGEPAAAVSVTLMDDETYSGPLADPVTVGDTLYIELLGSDWNVDFVEPALVILTSALDPIGIAAALIETGSNTGIYRGRAYVDSISDDGADAIGVGAGDEITVRASIDPLVFCVTPVATASITFDPENDSPASGVAVHAGNHPDPFRDATEISYVVPATGRVSVEIYSVSGRLIRTLVDESMAAGSHGISWDARDSRGHRVAGGVYLCRVTTEAARYTDKMVLLR
jgi:hypothetical protein